MPKPLETLETIYITGDQDFEEMRFPIQTVIRPKSDEFHDYRGYAGRVAGGVMKEGEEVILLPSGFKSKIKSIDTFNGKVKEAFPPMSVSIELEDDIDLGRGDMIVKENYLPESTQDLNVMLCWLNNESPTTRSKYYLKHTSNEVKTMIKEVVYKVDVNTLEKKEGEEDINMNDIVRVKLRTTKPLFIDSYSKNRITGSLILIDATTSETVAAGMII